MSMIFFIAGQATKFVSLRHLGMGFGMIYLPSVVSIMEYFSKKRALATGIAVCSSGVGTFAIAPIINTLLNAYGWRGTVLMEAGMILNVVVSSTWIFVV